MYSYHLNHHITYCTVTAFFICTNAFSSSISMSTSLFTFLFLSVSDNLSFTSQLTLSCSFHAVICGATVYALFQFLDLNSASALSCCHRALTWFKFKLACMSLANQMFCMITYGWALSENQRLLSFLSACKHPPCFYTHFLLGVFFVCVVFITSVSSVKHFATLKILLGVTCSSSCYRTPLCFLLLVGD